MKHMISFEHCDNKWDNALPIGNGCFGAMLFFEEHTLYMPLNHYEVYYNIGRSVLPEDMAKEQAMSKEPGERHKLYQRRAEINQPKNDMPFCTYTADARNAWNKEPYAIQNITGSYPATGEVIYSFDNSLSEADQSLVLYVEDAVVTLSLKNNSKMLEMKTIAARKDCIINKVTQSEPLLLNRIGVSMKPYRDLDAPDVIYRQLTSDTFAYTVSRLFEGTQKPFVFSGMIKLVGAEGRLEETDYGMDIYLEKSKEEFYVLTGIFTDWRHQDTLKDGLEEMQKFAGGIDALYREHEKYWKSFFERSSISLPDQFLEHVYYVNQYALDCCSGKDGVMKHHACGLNGLWDIRHPNLWGSMWYWDVNIQASFAGVFTGNRLELGKVFSDGLLSYVKLAEKYARDVHDMPGVALDYPYQNYYCVWPWCAQYLWWLYEYSLDEEYLRKDAYPLFLKLCEFSLALFQYDERTDTYQVYPDISPEQGPLAHNTTITVACVKYLLTFTLEAAQILDDNNPLLDNCRRMLEKLPPYALSEPGDFGIHLKDSPDAPDNMWIRHPSMLMPLFPIGEYDSAYGDEETMQVLSNTIDFLEDHCEIGIFGGSWLAAAAARLGRGQTALRLIYERGIDHMLRSNGLTAEETERFINYCLIPRQPLYYPCMMEFTGEMLAAVNEMLLQSYNNLIRVFPALPDGSKEWERMKRKGYPIGEYIDRYVDYDAWKTVRFDKLLAKGAFEISASLTDGKLDWILLRSKKGGGVRLTSPFLTADLAVFCEGFVISFALDNGILCFATQQGKTYVIAHTADAFIPKTTEEDYCLQVLEHEAYTKRKVFIGENEDTAYHKALDGFLRDWYLGNRRMENHTLYKFDFGVKADKIYTSSWTRQAYTAGERVIRFTPFVFLGEKDLQFTVKRGYGFFSDSDITAVDRGGEDCLRRDFVQGYKEAEFIIDAPRGQYEFLVISGDEQEDSVTIVETINGFRAGGDIIKKGRYQSELVPVIQKRDKPIRLRISTKPGYTWKINCLFLNTIKGY